MSEPQLPREVRRRLAIIHHAEEVTGNVAMTCRYYGISRQVYYRWLRRYQEIAMYLKRYHDVEVSHSGVWRILKRLDQQPQIVDVIDLGSCRCSV
jgi:transposase-like protein